MMNIENNNQINNELPDEEKRRGSIKKEDKYFATKFFITCIASGLIGGAIGVFMVKALNFSGDWEKEFPIFWNQLQLNCVYPARFILPVVGSVLCIWAYANCQIARKLWKKKEEREENWDKIEKMINLSISIANVNNILLLILYAVSAYALTKTIHGDVVYLLILSAGYVGFLAIGLGITKVAVNLNKEMNPNQSGCVYERKFVEKWYKSCDEAERMQIGIASYKSMRATMYCCLLIIMLLIMAGTLLEIGLLPVFCVGIIWLTQTIVYQYYAKKASKMLNN